MGSEDKPRNSQSNASDHPQSITKHPATSSQRKRPKTASKDKSKSDSLAKAKSSAREKPSLVVAMSSSQKNFMSSQH